MKCNVEVMNVPKNHDKYIVARLSDGELWYWGSWNDEQDANIAAEEVDGIVFEGEQDAERGTEN